MKASEFMKRHEKKSADDEDHSLQAQAKEHARHPTEMNAGTAFDWEDMEAYQRELERLEREGPGTPKENGGKRH